MKFYYTDYDQPLRPQLHFSAPVNWLNDPNGLVYVDGIYHLFYQYNPQSIDWANMNWGHATSQDLVKWKHQSIAIEETQDSWIFSGSAVFDQTNQSGLGEKDREPIIAFYTDSPADIEVYVSPEQSHGWKQKQCIAYSLDKGNSWIKYSGNPVLESSEKDFRDPKVFRHEDSNHWIMVVALPIKRQVNIYHSPDLLHWTKSSEFGTRTDGEGEWECPDLFPLTLEDGSVKWVLVVSIGGGTEIGGSATKYFVGDFDGAQFLPDKASDEGKWLDYGPDFYAFQSWYNIHHDEKGATGIAWMNNRAYAHYIPTFPWRGAMTLPRIMKLVNIAGEFLISQKPIAQLNKQRRRELFNLPKQALLMKKEFVELGDQTPLSIEFSIEPSSAADNAIIETKIYLNHLHYVRLVIDTHARTFILDRSNSGYGFNRLGDELFYKSYVAPIPVGLNKCDVRIILDRSSIEVFAFDGLVTFTANLLTVQKNRKLIITNLTNEKCSVQAKVWSLGSIWQEDP